ncbi:MAG: F0F1 ATP synthase subunit epsilon [Pseudomonadota bacterium]
MADMVTFDLVSPERLLRSSDVHMVVVPGAEGDFGVLAHHAPFMSTLRSGAVDVYASETGDPEKLFVSGGFAEVSDNRLTILAEDAVAISDVNADDIRQQLADAREDLKDASDEAAQAKHAASVARLTTLLELL